MGIAVLGLIEACRGGVTIPIAIGTSCLSVGRSISKGGSVRGRNSSDRGPSALLLEGTYMVHGRRGPVNLKVRPRRRTVDRHRGACAKGWRWYRRHFC